MEIRQELLTRYTDSPKIKQILEKLRPAQSRLQISGMIGAQEAFILASLYQAQPQTHLFVATDKEEAAYLQNDLSGLLGEEKAHFYTDAFRNPLHFEKLAPENVLQRTELVNRLTTAKHEGNLIVTYPEALFEKVVAPQILNKNRIEIASGAKLDVPFLTEVLVEYGFQRVDFVYEPGQFSIRGGIVDVYSFGNEYPYRIELFDIEVESIRTFDPITQLSQRRIAKVSIVPNMNTKFKQNEKVSLFQILPENTVIWLRDISLLSDKLMKCHENADKFAATLSADDPDELRQIFNDRAFIRMADIIADIRSLRVVLLRGGDWQLLSDENLSKNEIANIVFSSRPQPSFNKNFNILIQNLCENEASNIKNYLCTDNEKQMQRLFSIFKDLGAKVQCMPFYLALREGFVDLDLRIACYTDHQIFERYHRYRLRRGFSKDQALNTRLLRELQAGDFVTHIDHGIGRFSGLEKINVGGQLQEAVRLVYQGNDLLYVSINSLHKIAKYVGKDGTPPKLHKLGTETWANIKKNTKRKVKDIAAELIKLYAVRKASEGFAFPPDTYLQTELEASFFYEDTPDQLTATNDVKQDMEKIYPMDRLICGDVGFGKTEVAIRAAFKAVTAGKQVAILVPTTLLALQHFKTFKQRLEPFATTIDFLNRFKTPKERKQTLERVKSGAIDIIIGTHALTSKDVIFKDLGLLVIDEEQKFGVAAKEKIRHLRANIDTLTLTATPIPRTLQFSLMAARDLSIIRTPPPNRQPIHTEVRIFHDVLVKDAIYQEVWRGGQVFFVHNRVQSLPDVVSMLKNICPDLDIAMAHGQMDNLEDVLIDFTEKKYDILVTTNIIETGIDIPNANTMIFNNAHHFGMSDLHQLRGRVGRSNRKAYCYLLSPPLSTLTAEARKRLQTLESFSDLGDGFNIAMKDLDIRGAGNLLGGEQSGFIADIGYETYQKILEETIMELKQGDFKDLFAEELELKQQFVLDVQIDTDIEMLIPDDFVENTQERLNLYTRLDDIEAEEELQKFGAMLEDRFGKIPPQVNELFDALRLRWAAKLLGFERITLKNGKLSCFFVGNPQSPFYETKLFKNLLTFVTGIGQRKHGLAFKQTNRHFILSRENVRTLNGAQKIIELLRGAAKGETL